MRCTSQHKSFMPPPPRCIPLYQSSAAILGTCNVGVMQCYDCHSANLHLRLHLIRPPHMSSSYVLLMFSSHVSKFKLVPSVPAPAVCAISNTSQSHEHTHTHIDTHLLETLHMSLTLLLLPQNSAIPRNRAIETETETETKLLVPYRTAPTNHRCLATHMLYCDGSSTSSSTNKQHEHFIMRCPNDRLCPLSSHLH